MKDLIYELASLTLGVAEYLLYDLKEGQVISRGAAHLGYQASAAAEDSLELLPPPHAWTHHYDRPIYPQLVLYERPDLAPLATLAGGSHS